MCLNLEIPQGMYIPIELFTGSLGECDNGKIATGVPVKMYNEKDYKVFEKDNLTLPTAIIQTNESGMATFLLPREEWFATQSQRFLTFVVQEGGGPDNYQIWSSGKTVEAGKAVKVEIRLTQFPN